MSEACDWPEDLDVQLWRGPLADRARPERTLLAALAEGASYGTVLRRLRQLWRFDLPGAEAATLATEKWPDSIDFAVLALDLGAPADRPARLARLQALVDRANRRRAAPANACLRLERPDLARAALARIDPASPTATEDRHRRAELALAAGAIEEARADITALAEHGADALALRLVFAAEGAAALARAFDAMTDPSPAACARVFEIALREGDYTLAPLALARWQALAPAEPPALARAQARLELEQGQAEASLAHLRARLDPEAPWRWEPVDHILWLRARQAMQADPAALWAHAEAARRLAPRHDWLAHVAQLAGEAVTDWRVLTQQLGADARRLERRFIAARAALRLGLPARGLAMLASSRPTARARDAARISALRAEIFWSAGRLQAAAKAQTRAAALACDQAQSAEIAILGAEIALSQGATEAAEAALRPVAANFPARMPLALTQTRIAFHAGDFEAAERHNARFNALKAAQIGPFTPADLRDRLCADAAEATCNPTAPAASVGLAAHWMARSARNGRLSFSPAPGARIPRRIAHYWQGPPGPAIGRAQEQWQRLHPGFTQQVFDAESAAAWLARAYPREVAARFRSLAHPALQADLFRVCWLAQEGGIFADLDEFPRVPITSWLTGAEAVFCIERGFGTIANNFIAAIPDHPICTAAREMICASLDQTEAPYAWWHSGPAQWTRAVAGAVASGAAPHVRFLTQAQYNRRIATNLPYPHKRGPDHWR